MQVANHEKGFFKQTIVGMSKAPYHDSQSFQVTAFMIFASLI